MKIKKLDERLYNLSQVELIDFIELFLTSNGIPYKKDELGNIWSIRFNNKPVFVSHMDTIATDYSVPVVEVFGILIRPGGYILGGDDRAGINAILYHANELNFVFTVDEETGAKGAIALAANDEFRDDCKNITFFCEIDRRNGNNIIGHTHGYCDENLEDLVMDACEDIVEFESVRGSFTDIDKFVDVICQGFNISAGYYNAHTGSEYLNIGEYLDIVDCVPLINGINISQKVRDKKTYPVTYGSYHGYSGYNSGYKYSGYYGGAKPEVYVNKHSEKDKNKTSKDIWEFDDDFDTI